MEPSRPPSEGSLPPGALAMADRRWLHDKYERLAAEESQLSSGRTSYYAAIGTVLITGLIVALADLLAEPKVLVSAVSFLAALGLLISVVWAVLLHRTNDAQAMWREAALRLEEAHPPIEGTWAAPITLRSGERIHPNLLRPYETHAARFGGDRRASWMDRVNPSTLTEILPITFIVIWVAVVGTVWIWYFLLR
jgi:hypothetical protein